MRPIVLRPDPSQLDESWNFQALFPSPSATKKGMGKHISFTPKAITLDIVGFPTNRILHCDDPFKFVLASFGELRFPDTSPSVAKDYMIRFFKAGLNLNGVHYRFYGHSNSQLRGRSCFLREAKTDKELDERIYRLGMFDKIMNVAKRAKRIGLLFSAAPIDWVLDSKWTRDIGDIRSGGELFSDGCGLISKRLAAQLSRHKRIIFHGKNYTPCVYQIRYKGYKGVVMLHPDLDAQREAFVHFRASQKKFTATGDDIFSVVDHSVPYAFGRLNDDIIVLLASLGITTEQLLSKQKAYFDWIAGAGTSWEVAFDFLSCLGQFASAETLLLEGIDSPNVKSKIQALQNSEVASFRKKDHFRTRMMIHKSRLLFGVCDPYQVLREGEVHVRISAPRKGATTLTQIDVLVVRNPCLHPGDCLKLRAVDNPRLSHLVDCIVFPTVGKRAAPSMSSGGDLDGDRFFVLFDPDLIPTKVAESYNYPAGTEHTKLEVTREDLSQHFASYNSMSLARVSVLHRKWVRSSPDGAMSSQCQELNALHSLSVDGGRITIPDRLKSPPPEDGPYVLDVLAEAAKEFADSFLHIGRVPIITERNSQNAQNVITQLLSSEKLAVSEYEIVNSALAISRLHDIEFRPYLTHIDFSALTTPQKHALSLQIGLSPEQDPYVWNSLFCSDIITARELQYRSLDGPLRLQRLFSSRIQGRAAFFEYLRQAVENYTRKLIILKTDDRFAIGIFMKGQMPWNEDGDINDNVTFCSFMPNTGTGEPSTYRQGTKGYKLHCNENTMELFNGKRADTFVFITRPPAKSGTDIATSIALQKISKNVQRQCGRINRTPVVSIEIHVISNRDRVAHQAFDLRFDHVQTEEYLRRFDYRPTPYTPNSLAHFDWSAYTKDHKAVFTSSKEIARAVLVSALDGTLDYLMSFALHYRAEEQLFWIFEALMDREPMDHSRIAHLTFQHPALAYIILKRFLDDTDSTLPQRVATLAPAILRDVIRSANSLGIAALVAIEKLASHVAELELDAYFDLLWLASLSVRPRQLVQEILMVLHECRGSGRAERDVLKYAQKNALAIVFDRAEEAADECPCDDFGRPTKQRTPPVRTKLVPIKPVEEFEGGIPHDRATKIHVLAHVRVDAQLTVRIHSHVRLQVSSPAEKSSVERAVVDAVVVQASRGELRLELMHPLPPEFEMMDWNMYNAGSVATSKAMLDAVLRLAQEGPDCCRFDRIFIRSVGDTSQEEQNTQESLGHVVDEDVLHLSELNSSQQLAVQSADNGLALIWGPPGTGKTTVIVQILLRFLRAISQGSRSSRILMTASTHNAVDNVLERFVTENGKAKILNREQILRVATDRSKVTKALQQYTVDARVGGSLNENPRFIQQAEKRLKEAVIVFTTCAGAGLGIMRKVDFDTVLIDEASQVTEACALIPLVKGCQRAVLVGDHVQLRPTVKPMGKALQFDVSLLERLYVGPNDSDMSRTMLEIQYRFSDDIGRFPSTEFYQGRLRSGLRHDLHQDVLKASLFPWPMKSGRVIPNVFIPCAAEEDYGRSSKGNVGQVQLVRHIISLLRDSSSETQSTVTPPSIAVLTPYSRQVTQLREVLPSDDIVASTIDGFQGRESDIVIFSTVRCNAEGDIGFVEDARRLNVAWTRPKLALIIIGDRRTLEMKCPLWQRAIIDCAHVEIDAPEV